MICLTRLNGEPFALNPDLIERVEAHPDTVISLNDNVRFLVRESLQEVLVAIRDCRADVLATAYAMDRGTHPRPLVTVVPDDTDCDPTGDGDHAVLPFPHREER
ncbi:flagellar FlbD family protein [Klenkia terrae]|uniref:Flagellar FlbD family protein n=1 Tax=Klenkia terrae TaxID=1052259 RepID=A0ABU8E0X7_9ACTN|nr:flagellar FlbD family protein [Klenkia terrae]